MKSMIMAILTFQSVFSIAQADASFSAPGGPASASPAASPIASIERDQAMLDQFKAELELAKGVLRHDRGMWFVSVAGIAAALLIPRDLPILRAIMGGSGIYGAGYYEGYIGISARQIEFYEHLVHEAEFRLAFARGEPEPR